MLKSDKGRSRKMKTGSQLTINLFMINELMEKIYDTQEAKGSRRYS